MKRKYSNEVLCILLQHDFFNLVTVILGLILISQICFVLVQSLLLKKSS